MAAEWQRPWDCPAFPDHGAAWFDDEANENPNVTPMVYCQSGAARLIPRRTPASRKTLDEVGCQMKPSRAELFGSSPCVLRHSAPQRAGGYARQVTPRSRPR